MSTERKLTIEEIDKNMAINSKINKDGLRFFSMDDAPFVIYGGLKRGEDGRLYRLPLDVAKRTSPGVLGLCANTAGGRVRFKTDSKRIAIIAKYANMEYMSHFAITGSVGLDLYADEYFIGEFRPPLSMPSKAYESVCTINGERRDRDITINLPIYSDLTELYIGLDEDATLTSPTPYAYEKPIVYYGSSVTQGGCASRPGTTYQAYLTRWLGWDHINLGFSGSAKAEEAIVDYMASIENMGVFVCDYDHNSPSAEHLAETHMAMYRTVRKKQPNLPIVFMSRHDKITRPSAIQRTAIIKHTYETALSEGDENVYFVDGFKLLENPESTVDTTHPTDLGFYEMATKIYPLLKEILGR